MVGSIIGILPGVGGTVSNFLSYTLAMQTSKQPETFGKGNPEGLVAAMTATNEDTGALLPTVAFGIPGSAGTALLLGALILHGYNPGPLFITEHMDIVWALILGLLLANVVATTVGSRRRQPAGQAHHPRRQIPGPDDPRDLAARRLCRPRKSSGTSRSPSAPACLPMG